MREPPRASARERTARPSDEKILAAIRRAALHEGAEHGGATATVVLRHLAIPPRAARARGVRAALGELEGRGLTESWRRRGIERWRLSPAGASLLAAAARDGRLPVLPEAPQHRAWRDARAAANEELPRFAAALARDLDDASAMLARLRRRAEGPHSDEWLALGARLAADCRRIGSARHCLHEWAEPGDAQADRDRSDADPALRALRAGRRNIRLWQRPG